MIELWNPEGSKWAAQISRNYKMDLDLDDHGARDPKPIEWFEEPKIDGRVKKMVEVSSYMNSYSVHYFHTVILHNSYFFYRLIDADVKEKFYLIP